MTFSKTPSVTHFWNQRWTVLLLPNFRGRSFHLAPLSSIQKMPRTTFRLLAVGRPPSGLLGESGIRSSNQFNCSSVSFSIMLLYVQNANRFWDSFYYWQSIKEY